MPDKTHDPAAAAAEPFETPSADAQDIPTGEENMGPFQRQPDESSASPEPRDVRGEQTTTKDQSRHRRYQWFYEDLIS